MHDEFRVKVEVDKPRELLGALKAAEHGRDAQGALPRAAVTHEGEHVFIYTDSLQAAERAHAVVRDGLSQRGLSGELTIARWHPLEERWEDAAKPLPASDAERDAEHALLEQHETEESAQAGIPQWEVRITLPTHHDARAFAERLRGEGIPVNQQWRHLLVGANDEDDAAALAQRLRAEAPAGSELVCEGNGLTYWKPLHPFALLGGLGN